MRHSQPYPRLSFWLVLAGLAVSTPALTQVQDLGSTFDRSAVARRISANGRVIIGSTLLVDSFTEQPFRFTDAGGFEILPPFNGGYGTPVGVSDDGTFIAGYVGNARAVRWTEAGPPLDLTLTAASSTATAISGDGSTIVGAFRQPGSSFHCLRWTEAGGPVDIHPSFAPAHFTSWAAAVSQDGSVVVGSVWDSSVGSDYLPRAFVWTAATGAVDIGLSANADISTGLAVSDDGSVVAGAGRFGTQQLQPFV